MIRLIRSFISLETIKSVNFLSDSTSNTKPCNSEFKGFSLGDGFSHYQ